MDGRAFSGALLLGSIGLLGCAKEVELASAKVERRDVIGYELLDGKLVTPPSARADVLSPYRAPVDKVYKSIGDSVKRGEPLIQLAVRGAQDAVSQAKTYLEGARAAYREAKAKYGASLSQAKSAYAQARSAEQAARTNMDPNIQMYSDARVAAEQAMNSAKADLDISLLPYKQQLDDANQYLDDARAGARQGQIRSPIAGAVVSINAAPGAEVRVDSERPVATIVNLAELQVHAAMDAGQVARLKPGTRATIVFREIDGKEFSGRISRVTSLPVEGESGKFVYTAVIDFSNEDAVVRPEMTVRMAGVRTGEKKNVLAVPNSAIAKDSSGKPIVQVLQDGKWIARVVGTRLTGLDYTEITSGLEEGETVQVKVEK